MDTPEGNQIGTPISKFEDSPVFNYINNLSPIKPVKSIDISGTFNSLSFASLPSVFTSPHLNSQKGPRFFRRHDLSDLPKPDFSSDDRTKGNGVSNVAQNSDCSAGMQDGFAHVNFIREDSVDLSNENSELPIELPQTLKYDSGSPDGKPIPIATHGNMSNPMLEITGTSAALDQFVQETSFEKHHSFDTEVELQRVFCHGQTKEERMGSDSENLISDAANLFIFDASKIEASKEQDQALAGHESGCFTSFVSELPQDRIDDLHPKESICNFSSSEKHENQDLTSEVVEIDDHSGKYHSKQRFASTFHIKQDFNDPSVKISEKLGNHIALGCKQGGLPRRCLVFEMAGTHKRNLVEDHNSHSSISFPSDGELGLDDKKLGHPKPGASSSTRMLPGIGLHLNALAVSTKDCKFMKHETLASGNQLVTIPSSVDSFHSLTSEQVPVNKSLDIDTTAAPDANEILVEEDDSQSAFGASEEFNHSNVKKKRRKLEHSEESGACKRCNCKKSKCLKLYCECFAAGLYCVEPCSCKECFNKPIHEDTVLATRKQIESRNSLAFAPKVIVSSEYGLEIGEESNKTPASARHKRGCNCKKSSCLKKYCECYQGGVGCSSNCRCESCKNTFGRKDGTEEEESESCEKFGEEEIPATDKAQNEEDKCSDHFLPTTPSLRLCRQSVQVLFSSRGKPPQSFVLSVESSPQLPTTSQIAKSDSFRLQPKFGKHFQIISEGETPDILRENCSPIRTLKIASPNCKRISPPHNEFMVSPGPRPTRKLVLQSIPSSLSLTHRKRNLQ